MDLDDRDPLDCDPLDCDPLDRDPLDRDPLDPGRIEVMDDDMAEVLRAKSGAERLQIAFGMYESTRRMLTHMLEADHPDWSPEQIRHEVSRRMSHDSG